MQKKSKIRNDLHKNFQVCTISPLYAYLCVNILAKERSDNLSLAQPIIDKLKNLSATSTISDSTIREYFPLLLSGFDIIQKELLRISTDLTILKTSVRLADSDDEDYVD
jgi:hypothetical protein